MQLTKPAGGTSVRSPRIQGAGGAGEDMHPATERSRTLGSWIQLLRPPQWIKNFFVLAPLLFSGQAGDFSAVLRATAAFVVFCLLASGVYALNDVADRTADQVHPVKRFRPVADGRIAVRDAIIAGIILVLGALSLAWLLDSRVVLFALAYLALNLLYTWRIKSIVVLDVFVIASFFVLRLLAGAAAIGANPSVWLLLCGGLLALYLGFTKRRHELVLLGGASSEHRSVLSQYSATFLDQMSMVLLSVTTVCYIMYTLESETATEVGSEALTYSTVFVLYGVFRYLYLVHKQNGGSPTQTLLSDNQLMLVVAAWLLYCGMVIYRPF